MDQKQFARLLGHIVSYAGSKRRSEEPRAIDAYKQIASDHASLQALHEFCDAAGFELMIDRSKKACIRVYATDNRSPFGMKGSDIQKSPEDRNKLAYATLAIIASFYPSKQALNEGLTKEIDATTVLALMERMNQYTVSDYAQRIGSEGATLAQSFANLSDDLEGGRRSGVKITWVERAFSLLEQNDFVKKMDRDGQFMPTAALRQLTVERLEKMKENQPLAQLLSEFYEFQTLAEDNADEAEEV